MRRFEPLFLQTSAKAPRPITTGIKQRTGMIEIQDKKMSSELEYAHLYAEKVSALLQKQPKTMYGYVHSYGCQQNVSDGEKIMGLMTLMGYTITDDINAADIVIYNTCAVRENAEDKLYGDIGELKHNKARNRGMIIGLCGCMTQQEHISAKIRESYPQIDLVFGTQVIERFPKLVYDVIKSRKRQFDLTVNDNALLEGFPAIRDKSCGKANLPIMYGCNNFCSYCVVPYVRGRERSRKSEDILAEFRMLVEDGYKEITLLGQNVNSYGKGLDEEITFAELLKKLNAINGDFRIRFMSSHPKDASFELIDAISECEKVCKHFHLPVQSGSDRILKLMNRHYTTEDYLKLVEYARDKMPEIAFTSDLIVGFPDETEVDFAQTVAFVTKVQFDAAFIFIYSKRVGTKAADIEDLTPYSLKSERFSQLLAAQKAVGREKYAKSVGMTYKVLVDGIKDGMMSGRADNYSIVYFKGEEKLIGSFVDIKITKSLGWALEGELI